MKLNKNVFYRLLIGVFIISILGLTGTACEPPCNEKNTPVIHSFVAAPQAIAVDETSVVTLTAIDPNGSALTYIWSSTGGDLLSQNGKSVSGQPVPYSTLVFKPPDFTGDITITVAVKNAECSVEESLVIPIRASEEISPDPDDQSEPMPTFTPTPATSITITDTCTTLIHKGEENTSGEFETVLEGTSIGIEGTSLRVYLIVDPVKDGFEWVQGPPVGHLEQDNWSGVIRLGGEDTYHIRAIATSLEIETGQHSPDDLPKAFNDPTLITSNILECERENE